jgi:hypothetical protein
MKTKTLALLVIVLAVSITASVAFAKNLPAITSSNKIAYKSMLQTYFKPVFDGYGIGLSGDTYVTARWYITSVRTLNVSGIKQIVSSTNATDWSQLRQEIQNALKNSGIVTQKGRIMIGNTTYVLTNIQISNTTASADIRELPNYTTCKEQNTSAEDCENNAAQVGSLSLSKKTNALQDTKEKVWAGTLIFKSVTYTFVTFAYPRW